jgi:S1-C subfamily serine protease
MRNILNKNIKKIIYTIIPFMAAICSYGSLAVSADMTQTSDTIKYQAKDRVASERKKFTHFTSGTGFFVSNNQIVTNEHVVQGCKYIKVRGATDPTYVKIMAVDKENDLALLKTPKGPERVAQLRSDDMPITEGEQVTIMGYPLENGITGQYAVKQAVVTDTNDVYEGVSRIQFTDSVEKGNSGGPLMDGNGNVIGVVVGKMSFYLADASTEEGIEAKPVKTSSIAINLDSLRSFLSANHVFYKEDSTHYTYPDKWMERKAKYFPIP